MRTAKCSVALVTALLAFSAAAASDNELPSVGFTTTPYPVVDGMLELAGVGHDDYLIDLGSGDGRIVIAAAARGALAHGVEIEPELVALSYENAREAGVRERVRFLAEDFFDTELSMASVVTLYVLESTNIRLKPLLLEHLAPGSRVVSHRYRMGDWEPDATREIDFREVHQWTIPADFDGRWRWEVQGRRGTLQLQQRFQNVEDIRLELDEMMLEVKSARIEGEHLAIDAQDLQSGTSLVFRGRFQGGSIKGDILQTVDDQGSLLPWRADRITQ